MSLAVLCHSAKLTINICGNAVSQCEPWGEGHGERQKRLEFPSVTDVHEEASGPAGLAGGGICAMSTVEMQLRGTRNS